jgi:2-polyprenyl-3-methyl-5-hydroxy-6-metoxy-1,4-benzoquinol methylase
MISLSTCPVCQHSQWTEHFQCTDHTVSHETFRLTKCTHCAFVATNPRPSDEQLPAFYKTQNYISHTGKANSLIDRLYLFVRTYSLNWKLNLISQNNKPVGHLLDYGCGTGDFLKVCHDQNINVAGVEPSDTARRLAAQKISAHLANTIDEIPDQKFDVITLWHVLEHVPDLGQLLTKLKERLTEDGTLFIAVPNYQSYDGKYYKHFWAGYDVPRHLWHFTQSSMTLLLSRHSMNITRIIPMKLDAFYVSMLSEKYKKEKVNVFTLVKAFFIGLRSNIKATQTGEYSSLIYVIRK